MSKQKLVCPNCGKRGFDLAHVWKPMEPHHNLKCSECGEWSQRKKWREHPMTEEEYNLRLLIYRIGKRLEGDVLEEDDIVTVGKELIAESQVCPRCDGTGEDGDPDGGTYACETCCGKAVFA